MWLRRLLIQNHLRYSYCSRRSCKISIATQQLVVLNRSYSFITTPIFYVNSYPHIGHLYTLLLSDAANRFQAISADIPTPLLFTTGTDEHGQKVQRAATSAGISAQKHCDKVSGTFRRLCSEFDVSNTDFIRTTEGRHVDAVQTFWNLLVRNGHIYKGKYEGWYCVAEEAFLPNSHQILDKLNPDGTISKVSAESGQRVEWITEENYMFNLKPFLQPVRDWIQKENPIQPQIFVRPVLKWLEEENCPDLSVSRPSSRECWGISVPGDSTQVIYVWLDALVNYLTCTGYPAKISQWPPTMQIVGKDILKFHAIYWPAFLFAAGLAPPEKILCHSHWTIDNVKMSKTLGNVIDPFDLKGRYGLDAIRYFLLREGVPHSDGNFNEEKLLRMVNAELADTLGNLLSRCTSTALNPHQIWPKFMEPSFNKLSSPNKSVLRESVEALPEKVIESYSNCNFYRGIEHIMATLRTANLFMEEEKPWTLVKVSPRDEKLLAMTSIILEALRVCGTLLLPITPSVSTQLLGKHFTDPQAAKPNIFSQANKPPGHRAFAWRIFQFVNKISGIGGGQLPVHLAKLEDIVRGQVRSTERSSLLQIFEQTSTIYLGTIAGGDAVTGYELNVVSKDSA